MTETQPITLKEPTQEMIIDIMLGEYMDISMRRIKNARKCWYEMNSDLQQTLIDDLKREATHAITQMVRLTASIQYQTMVGTLQGVQFKQKHISSRVDFSLDDKNRHELSDFNNKKVVMVLVDPDDFILGEGPVPEPDQKPLNGFGEERED